MTHTQLRDTARVTTVIIAAVVALLVFIVPAVTATGIAETPAPAATRSVTDSLGRVVDVPVNPQRIVTAGRSVLMTADVLYAFPGISDRIVGIGRISQGEGSFPEAMDDAYSSKTVFERNVGPEQIVAVAPDLVILKTRMRENLGRPLERLQIPVLYVDLETPEQYERDIRFVGAALGQAERAEELVTWYRDRRTEITDITGDIPANEKPSVLLLYHRATGGDVAFQVPPAEWIQTQLVTEAGGTPVWTDSVTGGGWQTVGFEQIATWDPSTIIVISYNENPANIRDRLQSEGRWQQLTAVKENRFYAFPGDYYSWDQPDTRWILGLTWLATRIHPDRFSHINMIAAARSFYKEVYRLDQEAFQQIIEPVLTGDID